MTEGRSALVVGATGFVGRHLVDALRRSGWRAVALQRGSEGSAVSESDEQVQTAWLRDVTDLPDILDATKVDTVFHLAAHQSRGHGPADIDMFVESNLRLGLQLFEAASARGLQVVNTLSYFQYRGGEPASHSLYSATKQAQAEFSRYWREQLGADIRDVVLFDNFGPNDRRDKLIPALIDAVRGGEPLTIGSREQVLDLLHVADVARGLIAVAEGNPGGTLSVRADEGVTVGQIVDLVSKAADASVPVVVDTQREPSGNPVDAGDWARPFGWRPQVELSAGIAECVAAAN